MKCAVCARQAKGLGYFNPRLPRSDSRRYSDRWVFCSMRCQNAFSKLMARLTQFQEDAVIDPSDMEIAAMRSALGPLGEYVASIGMDRPLADYGKDEVLRLVEVVVDAYQAHMLAEHERMTESDRHLVISLHVYARRRERLTRNGSPSVTRCQKTME